MKCVACGRTLIAFAYSVETKAGVIGWGPKCARAVQIVQTARTRRQVQTRRQAVTHVDALPVDPRQMAIDFEAAA